MNRTLAQGVSLFINLIFIILILVGVTLAQTFYVNQFQARTCYDYAREKQLPELDRLEFTGVVIASNRFRGHICQFEDSSTGFPVTLEFDEADIPAGGDTLQVLFMICCGITPVMPFWLIVWSRWNKYSGLYQR